MGSIIAIEFKLKSWKKTMKQAYRYRSFSCESYVFLDQDNIKSAKDNIDDFLRYNIGLCGIEENDIQIYYKPKPNKPFCYDLHCKA